MILIVSTIDDLSYLKEIEEGLANTFVAITNDILMVVIVMALVGHTSYA